MNTVKFILLFFCLFALKFPPLVVADGDETSWRNLSLEYINASRQLAQHADKPSDIRYYQEMLNIEEKLRETNPPTVEEINALLSSEVNEDRSLACVAVSAIGKYSKCTIKRIANLLHEKGYDEAKSFCVAALHQVHSEDLGRYEMSILDSIEAEDDALVLVREIGLLGRFKPEDSAAVAIKLLLYRSDPGVKKASYAFLASLGSHCVAHAMEQLRIRSDTTTLDLIEEMQNRGKDMQTQEKPTD